MGLLPGAAGRREGAEVVSLSWRRARGDRPLDQRPASALRGPRTRLRETPRHQMPGRGLLQFALSERIDLGHSGSILRSERRRRMSSPRPRNRRFRDEADRDLRLLVEALFARLRPQRILVFGSVARGDVHQGSDLDLILIGDFSGSRRDRVDQVLEVAWALGVRRRVEPLVYTPEEFERAKRSPDFAALLAEAREVTPAQLSALRPS